MYKLVIEDDEGKTTVVPLVRDEITIGRKDGNTIRLTERNISRFHAKILRSDGVIIVEDLDSYNGVKVNGDRISGKSQVKEGDVIEIGDYHLQLRQESDLIPVGAAAQTESTGRYSMEELARQTRDEITPVKVQYPEPRPVEAPAPVSGPRPAAPAVEEPAQSARPTAEQSAAPEGEARPIAEAPAMLVVIGQQFQGREFALNKTSMHIGRTDDNDIAIDHRSISKNHAKIILEGGAYKVIDLKSANGVLVNGEQYAKTELKNGDVIELGHIKFRFVDRSGAEAYSPETQHTAIVHRSAISGRPGAKPAAKPAAAEAEAEEVERAERTEVTAFPKAGGRTGLIVAVLVVVLVLGAAGVYFLAFRGGGAPSTGPGSSTPAGKASQLIEEARVFMDGGKWGEARNKLEQAVSAEPNNPRARETLEKLSVEEANKDLYERAKASATLNNWDDAWKKMNQISHDSFYYRLAVKELPTIREKYIGSHLEQGMEAERNRENAKAIDHFKAVLDLDDQNVVAAREVKKLQGGGPVAAAEKPPPGPAAPSPRERPSKEAKGKERPPPEEKTPPPPPEKGQEPTYIDYYNEGNKLYLQNRVVEAVSMFQKCIKANARYPQCHRSLGIAYAKLGQGDRAAKEYKQYLQYAPDAPDRKQLQQIIDEFEKNK